MAEGEVPLRRTPLYALHVRLGARMVPFAGYEMPLQYAGGIIAEHLHTRAAASLFDVSHMGQIVVRPRSGRIEDAARALEALVPGDILGLAPGRQRYTLLTNDAGGVRDDIMVSHQHDHLAVVVNAACKEADEAQLRACVGDACEVTMRDDRALVALQGPRAEAALARLAPEVAAMRFMDAKPIDLMGERCLVSRSGYTGEDGFEISMPVARAEAFCEALLEDDSVAMAGLGARDTLRLEAGLCLYGSDLDVETTPVEAALEWTIAPARRAGGARAGGFPGAHRILDELAIGAARRRVGLEPQGRAPVRAHAPLFRDEAGSAEIGMVTSGGFGPSLDAPIAMGYVSTSCAPPGTPLFAEVRGKRLPVAVAELPFVARITNAVEAGGPMIKYTTDHEWIRVDGDIGTVGITQFAQEKLGDLVFVELPAVGASYDKGQTACTVESVKAAADVFAPVGGEIVAANDKVTAEPGLVNSSPTGDGWLFQIRIRNAAELAGLMDEEAYDALEK